MREEGKLPKRNLPRILANFVLPFLAALIAISIIGYFENYIYSKIAIAGITFFVIIVFYIVRGRQ